MAALMLSACAGSSAVHAADAYIESDGTQFINTGYFVKPGTRIEVDYQFTAIKGQMRVFAINHKGGCNAEFYVQGSAEGSGNLAFIYGNASSGNNWYDTAGGLTASDLNRHTAFFDMGDTPQCQVSGSAARNLNAGYIGGVAKAPLFIFAKSSNYGNSATDHAKIRLYSFKIYENGELLHDYVPAVRGGVASLYDTVAGEFMRTSPADGNDFTYGGDIRTLEGEDAYIESDGTQFINTGYYLKPTSRVELDYAMTGFEDTSDYVQMRLLDNGPTDQGGIASTVYIAGTAGTGNHTLAMVVGDRAKGAALSGTWTSVSGSGTQGTYCDDTRRTAVIDQPAKTMALIEDGAKIWYRTVSDATTKTAAYPLGLLGYPVNEWGSSAKLFSHIRVYGFRIYERGRLLHDFKPAKQDGTVGLRDRLTGGFITDTRSTPGVLAAGGNLPEYTGDGYVESHGDARQGVNTRWFKTPTTKFSVDFQLTEATTLQVRIFGMDTASSKLALYVNGSGGISFGINDDFLARSTGVPADTGRHRATCDLQNKKLLFETYTVNGWETTWTNDLAWAESFTNLVTATRPLALFGNANNNNGTAYAAVSKMKLYRATIWDNGVLKHDYMPCVKGDVPGLMDLIDGEFVTNEPKRPDQYLAYGGNIRVEDDDLHIIVDGTKCQVIDTGYFCTGATRIEADFAYLNTSNCNNRQEFIFGHTADKVNFNTYINGNNASPDNYFAYSCNVVDASGADNRFSSLNVSSSMSRKTIIIDPTAGYAWLVTAGFTNAANKITSNPAADLVNTYSMPLFTRRTTNGRFEELYPNAKFYGMKIFENGVLVKEYKPACQDGVTGVRETVSGAFLTPNTAAYTTPFVLGGRYVPDAEDEPQDAYVESDGTQVVNLGYHAKGTSRIEFDYAYLKTSENQVLCGAWDPESGETLTLFYAPWNSGLTYKCIFGHNRGEQRTDFGGVVDLMRHTVVMDFKNKKVVFRTGAMQTEKTYSTYADWTDATTCEIPMGVFGHFRNAAATTVGGMRASARVYGIKIYENDELVHDYVPYRKDGEVGFYDVVTKAFRVNARIGANPLKLNGGGTFRAQPQGGMLHSGKTLTLAALAAGAQAYQWYRDGEPVAGATDDTLTVAWEKGTPSAVYTVKSVFDLYGTTVETVSSPAEVTFAPRAFVLIVR